MEGWQWVLAAFLALLPLVLMLDFWGDERLTWRGAPITRHWRRQQQPPTGAPDDEAH